MFEERREKRLPEKEGVLFLIYKEGKVLLEERLREDKAYYGYTIIPGGKVEKISGESHLEAAKREISEECGICATDITRLDTFYNITISNNFYNTSAYLVTDYQGDIRNVEGKSRHLWVDINEAPNIVSFANDRYIILMAKLYLNETKLSVG